MTVGDLVELGGGQLAPGPLGGPVRRVEQRERTVGAGFRRRVVAQVRGEEGVHAGRPDVVEEAVAGAAADGDRPHRRLGVAGDTDALRGGRKPLGGAGRELTHGERRVQLAHAAQSPPPSGSEGPAPAAVRP